MTEREPPGSPGQLFWGILWGHCLTMHLATGQFTGDGKDVFWNHLCPACADLHSRSRLSPLVVPLVGGSPCGRLPPVVLPLSAHAEDLGELSENPFNPDSTSNPFSP